MSDQLSYKIAKLVRALRTTNNLSQEELARRVGTKQPAIARLESGKIMPTLVLLEKIADVFGLKIEVIMYK